MSPVLYCGHTRERVVYHEARLEFGVDWLIRRGDAHPWGGPLLNAFPRRNKRFKPGWPKGWPKPPTWTYTWFR
jgi:hypothetical protein